MDNLCHTLVGAALGEAGLKRRTRFGSATLMIASNLPDPPSLVPPSRGPESATRPSGSQAGAGTPSRSGGCRWLSAPGRVTVVSRLACAEAPESVTDADSDARTLSRADNYARADTSATMRRWRVWVRAIREPRAGDRAPRREGRRARAAGGGHRGGIAGSRLARAPRRRGRLRLDPPRGGRCRNRDPDRHAHRLGHRTRIAPLTARSLACYRSR